MNSVIEDSRQVAQDVDQYEKQLAALLSRASSGPTTHRQALGLQHQSSLLVERIVDKSATLLASLIPGTAAHQERELEIVNLTGVPEQGGAANELGEFYARLAKIKEYHRKYPEVASALAAPRVLDLAQGLEDDWLDRKFTGEEGLGRYVDVHELHELYNNLSATASSSTTGPTTAWKKLTYLQYLEGLAAFQHLSLQLKGAPTYSAYLTRLLTYLSDFYERVFPLGDLDSILKAADTQFAAQWEQGNIKGWTVAVETSTESEGIWCAACQKLYSKQTVYDAHLTSKKHIKSAAKLSGPDAVSGAVGAAAPSSASLVELRQRKNRALALKEALITALVTPPGPLATILAETQSNTERRAALTDRERATELEESEAREAAEAAAAAAALSAKNKENGVIEQVDDDDEGRIYNPLKLPMGWDGKPIPFWLYKLHGLGVEYTCEICSDTTYMGRKVFERHFQESRHAFGMKALGLPNTKHFHEITRIEDAIALAEKLKQEGKREAFQSETMEELEDDEGNVYNRKTFEDLKRQGLL